MVYVDLLVIEDMFLNYIIIMATGIILNRKTKFKKSFLSSVIGTIPLILLFIKIDTTTSFLINNAFTIIMSTIAFNYKDIIYTIKNVIYMYFISIFLAGSLYLLHTNFTLNTKNHLINLIMLVIISPIITYIHTKMIKKLKIINSNYYQVDIYLKDKPKITLNAFLDTGNKLIEPYTGKPIVLVSKHTINISNERIILVPYNTIDNHGILTCIRPQKIYIHKIGYCPKSLIGIIDKVGIEGVDCILNSNLLERIN